MKSFKLLEHSGESGWQEIRVEGELDLSVADEFQQALERARGSHDRVLVDLSGCEFIDSTGIALLVEAHNEMEDGDSRIAAYGASGQVARVLQVTGLTENGLVFETAAEAIAAE